MEQTLDKTTLDTISFLEARLLRVEHLLYGSSVPSAGPPTDSAIHSVDDLERRFSQLLSRVRVYAELLKIYKTHPSLFQPPSPSQPPTQLSAESLRSTVLSLAPSFPGAASALTAVTSDVPIPDASASASLASLLPRARAVEVMQRAQAAEADELRARSEVVLRAWHEGRVLRYGGWVAGMEGRVEAVEGSVRRAGRRAQEEEATV